MTEYDSREIRRVIEEAYIRGIHETQDRRLIASGFHPSFEMLVLTPQGVERIDVPAWMTRIDSMKAGNPELWSDGTSYDMKLVDVTGSAAVAKLDVFKGESFFSTDYMLLYKVDGVWKIVSKIFSTVR